MALTTFILLLTFISPLNSKTASSDTIQPTPKTVQKGDAVTLDIQKHENKIEFDELLWQRKIDKDNSDIVVSYNFTKEYIPPSYKEKVDFNTTTYSLTLKNTQETDSGIYTAIARGEQDDIIGQYNVTVGTGSHGSSTGCVSLSLIILLFLLNIVMIETTTGL